MGSRRARSLQGHRRHQEAERQTRTQGREDHHTRASPYWQDQNSAVARVATAMIMLDDAAVEHGCLEAAPGSHKGVQRMRQVEGFGAQEMDPAYLTSVAWCRSSGSRQRRLLRRVPRPPVRAEPVVQGPPGAALFLAAGRTPALLCSACSIEICRFHLEEQNRCRTCKQRCTSPRS